MPELFDDLAPQKPPSVIRDGRFLMEDCPSCRGSGRHRYSAFSGGYTSERFSERCPDCGGGGKRLVKARGRKLTTP
jgi:DnaJ-class molecular chaperone